jgi:flagellar biosynthetic protein FliO
VNTFLATVIVLGLVAALAWLVRRGPLARLASAGKPVAVETAIPLGERRSLVIVSVEGRRLLLGLTPTNISLVTELHEHQETCQLPTSNTQSAKASWELGVGGWALTRSVGRLFGSGVSQ